jgi:hypothetical protein
MNERITIPEGTAFNAIGQPVRRKEDHRLLTGKGRFTDDFSLDGQAYAAVVRSPHAHARIKRIDTAKAKAMPGVLSVFTGADVRADGLGPLPHSAIPSTKFDMKLGPPAGRSLFIGPNVLMPADKARHVGEGVAMVVAQTRAQAIDAAEAVEVEYEELPFVLHSVDALKPGAPAVWDEAADNLLIDTQFGDKAATDMSEVLTLDSPRDDARTGARAVAGCVRGARECCSFRPAAGQHGCGRSRSSTDGDYGRQARIRSDVCRIILASPVAVAAKRGVWTARSIARGGEILRIACRGFCSEGCAGSYQWCSCRHNPASSEGRSRGIARRAP